MSCETTLRRLEGRDGVAWIDPLLVVHIVPHSPGYSRVSWGRGENFTAVGTPDEVHRMLFPEEVKECEK